MHVCGYKNIRKYNKTRDLRNFFVNRLTFYTKPSDKVCVMDLVSITPHSVKNPATMTPCGTYTKLKLTQPTGFYRRQRENTTLTAQEPPL